MKQFLPKNNKEDEIEAKQAKKQRLRLFRTLSIVAIGVIISVVSAYWLIWPMVNNWRQRKDLERAKLYEEQGNFRGALLTLEQMVQAYPGNMEAKRRLANFYERAGQRQALAIWEEIVRLQPDAPANLLAWAGAALRFNELETARAVLLQLRKSGRTGVEYFRLSAGLALINRDNAALEENLAELARLQPEDLRVQLNLAITRLQDPAGGHAESARAALLQLARSDSMRIRAIVELFNDIARRWPRPAVGRTAAFQRLVLGIVPAKGPRLDPPEVGDPVERLLAHAMLQPAPAPEDAAALLSLMILNGREAAAFEWIDALPAKTRDSPPVLIISADAALRADDLPRLRKLLLAGAWGNVPSPAIDHAIRARENRSRAIPAGERSEWAQAIAAGHSSLPALQMLGRLSEAWQWPEERRQVLLAVTQRFSRESWAWRQLISHALAHGESEQLWQTYQRWRRALPGDAGVRTEAAIMGLLLQQRGAPKAHETAELVRIQPGNPGAAVAHALALWREKRFAEALSQLEALPPSAFAEPRFALAYGLLLTESGRAQESEAMLDRAASDRLLPEELLLIETARARNQQRLATPRNQ